MAYARDLYKTKMCSLYMQRGYCPRQSCSFAHGESELRKVPGRFDNGGDLRNAVDHRHSPSYWRRSPGRDERGRDWHENGSPHHDRGHTQSKSPAKRRRSVSCSPQKSPEYKKRDTKKHPDTTEPHLSDVSGPIDGAEDVAVDEANGKAGSQSISTSSQEALEEQLQEVSSFNKTLLAQKVKLEHSLEKKVLETTELSDKIVMLETKLDSIKDTCKGLASRTKKFVKVYKGFFRAQEELKRSQAKLMRLVDDISEDNGPMLDTDVEYLDINTTSYEDPLCEIPTNNQANHRPTAAGSHLQRQENDTETGNRLSSSIEEPLLTESKQHKPTAAQQERRRALVQKALKQGSLSLKTGDGRDGIATDHKMSSVVSLNGELK
ncbi:hypothetical protein BDL97_13G077400 [Sphagnum fallax]|nr:hypothetical protein BDL97_13G077400 [Sphagnum fallax]